MIEVGKEKKAKPLSEEEAKKRLYKSEQLKAVQKRKDDALTSLHAQEQMEHEQNHEQETARHLITEGSVKLAADLQKPINLQVARVVHP